MNSMLRIVFLIFLANFSYCITVYLEQANISVADQNYVDQNPTDDSLGALESKSDESTSKSDVPLHYKISSSLNDSRALMDNSSTEELKGILTTVNYLNEKLDEFSKSAANTSAVEDQSKGGDSQQSVQDSVSSSAIKETKEAMSKVSNAIASLSSEEPKIDSKVTPNGVNMSYSINKQVSGSKNSISDDSRVPEESPQQLKEAKDDTPKEKSQSADVSLPAAPAAAVPVNEASSAAVTMREYMDGNGFGFEQLKDMIEEVNM